MGQVRLAMLLFLCVTPVHADEHYRHKRHWYDCKNTQRTVGNQHLTIDGAKKAANDAWASLVRFRFGEVYMDLSNSNELYYTCSRSSISEGAVTTLGQTLTRCEIEAMPCKAPRER